MLDSESYHLFDNEVSFVRNQQGDFQSLPLSFRSAWLNAFIFVISGTLAVKGRSLWD
jgi:hypothetical protein